MCVCGRQGKCTCTPTCMYVWGANFTLITVRRTNPKYSPDSIQFSKIHSLSCVPLFATPWTTACQASLSITNAQSLPKLMSIESVMPSNQSILCRPLLMPSDCFYPAALVIWCLIFHKNTFLYAIPLIPLNYSCVKAESTQPYTK